jgi:hypothetical protein
VDAHLAVDAPPFGDPRASDLAQEDAHPPGNWPVKIVETVVLLSRGALSKSNAWSAIREALLAAIAQAEWPVGTGKFIIHPQSGKKSGEGNGVVPIKTKPMAVLKDDGWALEYPWEVATEAAVAS